jgi:hypothetical protein
MSIYTTNKTFRPKLVVSAGSKNAVESLNTKDVKEILQDLSRVADILSEESNVEVTLNKALFTLIARCHPHLVGLKSISVESQYRTEPQPFSEQSDPEVTLEPEGQLIEDDSQAELVFEDGDMGFELEDMFDLPNERQ